MLTDLLEDIAQAPESLFEDAVWDSFNSWTTSRGISLYPAQEEASLALLAGDNVILATPTGSGKSMVANAAHFIALARGQRSFYTAPIKALVSEKFFSLCEIFGPENVGMMTGDATVNGSAPIIAATAEIVANIALRDGAEAAIDQVVMDEFHYYSEPDRGWAWQVPLLELPKAQFLLMSATLGDTAWLEEDLTRRTGRPTTYVGGSQRPVPLDFHYVFTPVHETLEELLDAGKAPIYVVHFSQREATERQPRPGSAGAAGGADVEQDARRPRQLAPEAPEDRLVLRQDVEDHRRRRAQERQQDEQRVGGGREHLAVHPPHPVQVVRHVAERARELAGFEAGAHQAHEHAVEQPRVALQRVRQVHAAGDLPGDDAHGAAQAAVRRFAREVLEHGNELQAARHHGRELPGEDGDVVAAAEHALTTRRCRTRG